MAPPHHHAMSDEAEILNLDDLQDDDMDHNIGEENELDEQPYGQEDDVDAEEEADRLQAEETVLNNHLECVKQEAYLITVEGEIITKLENAMMNDEQYDMAAYLESAEEIARKKLAMYSELLRNIGTFKQEFMHGQQQLGDYDLDVPKDLMKMP